MCVPAGRATVVKLAVPAAFSRAIPSAVVPSRNVTSSPARSAVTPPAVVAVNMTVSPTSAAAGVAVRVVAVTSGVTA